MAFRIALIGAPNSGKSTLFNGLTGGRAKTANYSGVTVETKTGHFTTPKGNKIELYDLPGIYGLTARSLDERVAIDLLEGQMKGFARPELMLVVIDASNLRTHLHSVLQMRELGLPTIVVLNMIDLADRDGTKIDIAALQSELGVPVVATRATRKQGREDLLAIIDEMVSSGFVTGAGIPEKHDLKTLQSQARQIASRVVVSEGLANKATRKLDEIVLNPFLGPLILLALLFVMFQAVFNLAIVPMELIENAISAFGVLIKNLMGEGLLGELAVDGIIAGVGSVVIFLPQIIILFAFILALEASGYMARAAFLMDEIMRGAGLNGRAFIPLLSSFACAVPGIMSARVIEHERDRLTTILIAPLMTCSARLPVYTLIISAFIPNDKVGIFGLQGIVMFALYLAGVLGAFIVAFVLKKTLNQGPPQALIMELPSYKLPNLRDFALGIYFSAVAFLRRAGTTILMVSIVLWALVRFPDGTTTMVETYAGKIGSLLLPILRPIGFNLEIAIALIPGMAAREVAVGALGTIYAVQGGEANLQGLSSALQNAWSLPTALAFLAWYVFAPQCFATLATIRRETNSWKWPGFAFAYLLALAYAAAGITYHLAKIWL
ncbi:MAG: ferrous iron transport protein B [Hyphomonadaceae bacterium]|nr:MAG: ferrous iron transport protein B [Hyphomonadaceae bacterium]